MDRHQRLWPPSFREGALTLLKVGKRLEATLNVEPAKVVVLLGRQMMASSNKAPPAAWWVEVLEFLQRGWFEVEAVKPPCVVPDVAACDACGAPKPSKRCSQCHRARYCSRECQVGAWETHKNECKAAAAALKAKEKKARSVLHDSSTFE